MAYLEVFRNEHEDSRYDSPNDKSTDLNQTII